MKSNFLFRSAEQDVLVAFCCIAARNALFFAHSPIASKARTRY